MRNFLSRDNVEGRISHSMWGNSHIKAFYLTSTIICYLLLEISCLSFFPAIAHKDIKYTHGRCKLGSNSCD
jgi:hypothetical protein